MFSHLFNCLLSGGEWKLTLIYLDMAGYPAKLVDLASCNNYGPGEPPLQMIFALEKHLLETFVDHLDGLWTIRFQEYE